jgi:2'-hydroxyisoflavone reductase
MDAHRPTRRSFLGAAAAAAAVTAMGPSLPAAQPRMAATFRGKKTILVLGGTSFLGPAFVDAAIARGHTLTLFNRGKTNPGLFPDVEKIHGQRRRPKPGKPIDAKNPAQDLEALKKRKWDAVVDTSAYFTGEVEDVCAILAGNVAHYTFVSSMSVYKTLELEATPVDEQSPLCECKDKYTTDLGREYENYGALKRYCEDAVVAAFPGNSALVRPGYIVGPGDPSDRFTYWPMRFVRGGETLAPGDPKNDLQFIDVRDLGEWIVHGIEGLIAGPFNAVGFDKPLTTGEFLDAGKEAVKSSCAFTWVTDKFLEDNAVSSWQDMGCWTPTAKNGHGINKRMLAAGAKFRSVGDTVRATAEWAQKRPADYEWKAGITAGREAELLAKWKARQKGQQEPPKK